MLENSFNKMMTKENSGTVTNQNVPVKNPQPIRAGKKKKKDEEDASR
jgi:hypothetical protein